MEKKICITYYNFPHLGGISSIIDDLWEYLSTKYQTHIFIYKSEGDVTKYKDNIHICRNKSKVGPFIFPFIWFYLLFMTYNLWKFHKKYKFDLILSQDGFCTGLFSLIVGKFTGARVVIMDHGTVTNILDPTWEKMMREATSTKWKTLIRRMVFPLSKISFKIIIKFVTHLSNEFLFSGGELENYYIQENVPAQKLKRYSHLVNTNLFKSLTLEEKNKQRRNLGISPSIILINIITRLDEEKGFEYILPALERVRAEGKNNFIVLILGEGRRRKSIEEYIDAHHMEGYVKLLGAQGREDVKKILQISDIHLYAGTIGCSVSIALLEAMACGCAVIATSTPIQHKNIVKPETGWVIPPKDIDALINSLLEALSKQDKLKAMGENSIKYIEENHSFQAAGKYFNIFTQKFHKVERSTGCKA
jgi:glycosyltransferase involved in cell wall biosynthesis